MLGIRLARNSMGGQIACRTTWHHTLYVSIYLLHRLGQALHHCNTSKWVIPTPCTCFYNHIQSNKDTLGSNICIFHSERYWWLWRLLISQHATHPNRLDYFCQTYLSRAKRVTLFQRLFIFFTLPHGPHSFVNKKNGSILRPYHTSGGGGGGGGGGGAKMISHANLL